MAQRFQFTHISVEGAVSMSTHHPSGHQADDAYTPHELGLLMGNRWAEMVRQAGAIYDDGFGRRIDPVRAAAQEEPQIAKERYADYCPNPAEREIVESAFARPGGSGDVGAPVGQVA
jgi:hypothetical protein